MNNSVNNVAYLPTTRIFPFEIKELSIEMNRSYIDIANAVNNRTISIFPSNKPVITGESWFIKNQKQQSLRQVFSLTGLTSFNHGLNLNNISTITQVRGMFTDGTNYYPLPYVASTMKMGSQVNVYVSPTQIVILPGVDTPAFSSGFILLEWLADV